MLADAEVPAERLDTATVQAGLGTDFLLADRAALTMHGLCTQCRQPDIGQAITNA